jgi:F-type H+-transporting ATPase subunit delta
VASAGLALIRDLNNVRVVEVTTATGLDDSTRERVLVEIKKLHGGEIELSERVDHDIIGGYTLKMDDQMIDASTRRQLQMLRRELTEHDYEPEF